MQKYVTWVLTLSIVASPGIIQAGSFVSETSTAPEKVELRNVELNKDGSLQGQLLTGEGAAVRSAGILLHSQADRNQITQVVTTDENGSFTLVGVRAGTTMISVGEESYACRIWINGTAPPKSLESIALVASGSVIRGNNCGDCGQCADCRGRGGKLTNRIRCMTRGQKVGLGLVVAAAIVLPIALSNDKDNAS